MFASLESHIAAFAATLEADGAAVLHRFHDWVVGEEAKIAAEIEHLTGRGYTVTAPETVVPIVPQAPEAAAGS